MKGGLIEKNEKSVCRFYRKRIVCGMEKTGNMIIMNTDIRVPGLHFFAIMQTKPKVNKSHGVSS